MPTGIETAGLVLAIFPIVVKGFDVYLDGSRKVKDLWQWRRGLRGMLREFKAESALFENTCMRLLQEVVSAKEVIQLMGGEGWDDTDFQERLAERMGENMAEAFAGEVKELSSRLSQLREDMGLDQDMNVCIEYPKLLAL